MILSSHARARLLLALALLPASACASEPAPVTLTQWTPPSAPWVQSDRTHLRDEAGRVLVFRGVNARVEGIFDVSFDDGREALEPIPEFSAADARRMRELGMAVLRLPINWSGIEPVQGSYDEAYLDRVQALVALCAAEGIHVLIDFHQDAYGKDIGEDGAPLWAIQPPPDMLLEGPLLDLEARRTSEQVLRAFRTFFTDDDEDTRDVELQAAFAAMTRHVAARFASEPMVIGYDLYNEPIASERELWRFHPRVVAAIREVDTRHLVFFEPAGTRNLLDMAPLSPTPFEDAGGVYAVHLYTLAFLDPRMELDTITRERLGPNVERAAREAARFEVPMFVGEWGIRPDSPGSADYVRFMHELMDEHFASGAVWLWKEDSQGSWGFYDFDEVAGEWVEREQTRRAHARVRAEAIAGEPIAMTYDAAALSFELRYQGRSDTAPNVIYIPEASDFAPSFEVRCDGVPLEVQPTRDPGTGQVEVLCAGPGERSVTITGS